MYLPSAPLPPRSPPLLSTSVVETVHSAVQMCIKSQFILLGRQRHMCVNNLPRVAREAERPGLEPATSRWQVRRPKHYAIIPDIQTYIT